MKSFYCGLLCVLFCFVSVQMYAQRDDISQKDVKKAEKKKREKASQLQQNFGSTAPTLQGYQGTGRELTTKVKARSVKQIKSSESERANYSGNIKAADIKKIRAKSSKTASSYSGNIKYTDIKQKRADNDKEMASYSGSVKYVDIAKQRGKKNKKFAAYSGNISIANLRTRSRKIKDKSREIAAFSGNIRYVNIAKQRAKKDAKVAKFKGPNPIRIKKKPKGSITSVYKGAPNKNRVPANYNRRAFRLLPKVKKSELPNYQKGRKTKLKYNSRETQMWNGKSEMLPKRGERKLPDTKKSKKNKGESDTQETPTKE